MKSQFGFNMIGLVALLALLVGPWHVLRADGPDADPAQAEAKAQSKTVTVVVGEGGEPGQAESMKVHVEAVKPGKYWIGVICEPVQDELLQAQLDIEGGLVITRVVADSPAAKAGLAPLDILIQVREQPIQKVEDLVVAIEKAKAEPVQITILRKGKRQDFTVTPAERKETVVHVFQNKEEDAEWKTVEEALKKFGLKQEPDDGQSKSKRFMWVMPGVAFPEGSKPFPKNLQVNITKKGDEPARIEVQSGDQKWELDENSLDKLPEDIRPHVSRMLGKQPGDKLGAGFELELKPELRERNFEFEFKPNMPFSVPDLQLKWLPQVQGPIKKQLEQVQKQLESQPDAVSPDALERIQKDLQDIRTQLEQLRKEQQAQQRAAAKKNTQKQ